MEYKFIIKPEADACNRCMRVAYQSGQPGSSYNIHIVQSEEEALTFKMSTGELVFEDRAGEGRTGLLHPLCRCRAYAFEVMVGGRVIYQSRNKFNKDEREEFAPAMQEPVPTEPKQEVMGEANRYTSADSLGYGPQKVSTPDAHVRQRYQSQRMHARRRPGNPFATVMSNVITSLINSMYKLFVGGDK